MAESELNVFSLEEDDVDGMFITQESRNVGGITENEFEMEDIADDLLLSLADQAFEGKEGGHKEVLSHQFMRIFLIQKMTLRIQSMEGVQGNYINYWISVVCDSFDVLD